ncbi:MAG: hypothetical protein L6290_02845 [Thermodesulfovibrionales bacterium]|nr:hypothetical protein [Thermodesulfovibrionales bacterium]
MEETHIDLNGDSFRRKMLDAAKRKSISGEVDSFFWGKRLFQNLLSDQVFLKLEDRFTKMIKERNRLILLKLKWQRKLLRKALKISSRAARGSPYQRILSREEIEEVLQREGFEDIHVSVINYLNPIFPSSLVRAFDAMASHFSPVFFSPTAGRFFFSLPVQENEI